MLHENWISRKAYSVIHFLFKPENQGIGCQKTDDDTPYQTGGDNQETEGK